MPMPYIYQPDPANQSTAVYQPPANPQNVPTTPTFQPQSGYLANILGTKAGSYINMNDPDTLSLSGYAQTGGASQPFYASRGGDIGNGAELANDAQNPNSSFGDAYEWGGAPGAAAADIAAANAGATAAQNRAAPQADYTNANLAAALQAQAMGGQQNALGMYQQMANGQLPSAAQAGFAQAISAQQAAQASAAASARGGGLARAAAQRQAMQQSAATGQQNAATFAGQRANEINTGIQGYSGLATSMGAQDIAAQTQAANQANAQAAFQGQQNALNDAQNQSYRQQAMNIGSTQMQGQEAKNSAIMSGLGLQQAQNQFNTQQQNSLVSGAVGAVATAAPLLLSLLNDKVQTSPTNSTLTSASDSTNNKQNNPTLSDRRAKKDIKPADKHIEEFVKALQARDYEYKNPSQPGAKPGRHTSVMAQDLEKSEIGRRMVIDTPQGKMVDYKEGFAAAIAALPWMKKKIDSQKVDIEALKKAFSSKHARESAHA